MRQKKGALNVWKVSKYMILEKSYKTFFVHFENNKFGGKYFRKF